MSLEFEKLPKNLQTKFELSKEPKIPQGLFTNEFIQKCNDFLCEVPDEAHIKNFKVLRRDLLRFERFSESQKKVLSESQKIRDAEYLKTRLVESKEKGTWFKIFQELLPEQKYNFNLLLDSAAKEFGTVEKIRSLNPNSKPIEYRKILNKLFKKTTVRNI